MEFDTSSWMGIIGGVSLVVAKGIWDYLKKRNDNQTTVKINEESKYKQSRDELQKSNDELFTKLTEVEQRLEVTSHQLDKAFLAFKIIFPLIEEMVGENPAYKKTFDEALKIFNNGK